MKTLVAVLLAACGGSATVVKAPKAQPDVDAATAEKDAKGLVGEVGMSIGNGDTDGLMTLLSDHLVVFGPRKADALGSRADALVALGKIVDAKKKRPLKVDEMAMVAGPGGHSAWAFDVIDAGGGQTLAVMGVLTNTDDIWLVDAVSIGESAQAANVKKELARDAVVPPAMGPGTKVDGAAKAVVEKFQHGLAAQDAWGDDLGKAEESIVVGPTQGEVARGKKDVKKLWKKRLKDGTREIAVGDVTAAVTPDGRLAWASAPVTRVAETGESLPLRVFAVFEEHGGAWQMVALQESIAIDSPGAGVAFHKAPPPPPVAEKKEVVAVEDKPKPKKKAKKPVVEDDAAAEPAPKPKKKMKKKVVEDDATADEAPKPKKKIKKKDPILDDDGDEAPRPKKKLKKKKKKSDDDDVSVTND